MIRSSIGIEQKLKRGIQYQRALEYLAFSQDPHIRVFCVFVGGMLSNQYTSGELDELHRRTPEYGVSSIKKKR